MGENITFHSVRDSKSSSILSLFLLISACIVIPAILCICFLIYQGNSDGDAKDILIPKKSTVTSVAELLSEEQIVRRPQVFKWLLRLTRGSSKVRAGEFRFRTGMSMVHALQVLYSSEPIVHQITVPEGWSIRQISEILAAQKLVDPGRFNNLALSAETARRYKLTSPTMEGFLYPDTYTFSRVDGEEKILDRMFQHFLAEYNARFKEQAKNTGLTMEQIVTLASVVEKETGVPSERPLIASVFFNRLKKHMRLQSDPTTMYGIANFSGRLTTADLHRPTPYNTYTIAGLPPGPIASPGGAAIDAVLHPADSQYLYFVSNNHGNHIFSKNYGDHSRYVNTYQPKLPKRKH